MSGYATDLDELSTGPAASENVFRLEDLVWEHFSLDRNGEVVAGRIADPLILRAIALMGGIEGGSVLELGPYEGYYSVLLDQLGPARVVSVEGNPKNFLKCLAVANHYRLKNTEHLLGDCEVFLAETSERFDLVVATGVLYHFSEPFAALDRITNMTDAFIVCTTYYDTNIQKFHFTGNERTVDYEGQVYTLYERTNTTVGAHVIKHGMADRVWMFDRASLLDFIDRKGFQVEMLLDVRDSERLRMRFLATRR